MAKNSIAYTLFEEIVEFSASYEENYNNALNHFQYYKDQEIILDCDFDDSKWFFSDQYTNLAMVFRFSKVSYEKHFHSIFDISMEEFVTNLKIYIMLMMGKIVLISLKEILNDVKKLIRIDYNSLSLDSVVLNRPDHLVMIHVHIVQLVLKSNHLKTSIEILLMSGINLMSFTLTKLMMNMTMKLNGVVKNAIKYGKQNH